MNKLIQKTFLIIVSALICGVCIFAQEPKNIKPIPRKIEPRVIDPKKLFDPQKITKDFQGGTDLGVKGAHLSWADYGQAGFVLDVIPVLTKNSKTAKIYALGADGKVKPLTFTIEAIDSGGKVLEICTKELLGWTAEETETDYPVCSFYQSSWKNADRFRITADAQKILGEANTQNNVIVVKKTEFTGKEYSSEVSPLP